MQVRDIVRVRVRVGASVTNSAVYSIMGSLLLSVRRTDTRFYYQSGS